MKIVGVEVFVDGCGGEGYRIMKKVFLGREVF